MARQPPATPAPRPSPPPSRPPRRPPYRRPTPNEVRLHPNIALPRQNIQLRPDAKFCSGFPKQPLSFSSRSFVLTRKPWPGDATATRHCLTAMWHSGNRRGVRVLGWRRRAGVGRALQRPLHPAAHPSPALASKKVPRGRDPSERIFAASRGSIGPRAVGSDRGRMEGGRSAGVRVTAGGRDGGRMSRRARRGRRGTSVSAPYPSFETPRGLQSFGLLPSRAGGSGDASAINRAWATAGAWARPSRLGGMERTGEGGGWEPGVAGASYHSTRHHRTKAGPGWGMAGAGFRDVPLWQSVSESTAHAQWRGCENTAGATSHCR